MDSKNNRDIKFGANGSMYEGPVMSAYDNEQEHIDRINNEISARLGEKLDTERVLEELLDAEIQNNFRLNDLVHKLYRIIDRLRR